LVIGDLTNSGMTPQELSDRLWQFAALIAKVVDALPDPKAATRREIGPTSADKPITD